MKNEFNLLSNGFPQVVPLMVNDTLYKKMVKESDRK